MIREPKTAEEYLIHLCACALSDEAPVGKPDQIEWRDVFDFAVRHKVAGTSWYAAQRLPDGPEDSVWDEWTEEKNKATVRGIIQKNTLKEITDLLTGNGLRCMPLKGSVIRDLYPQPEMRVMGDLDILVDAGRMGQIKGLMAGEGYQCVYFGVSNHDVYRKPPIIDVEMHSSLIPDRLPLLHDYYADGFSHGAPSQKNSYIYYMPPEELYVFAIAHLYKHFVNGGTGIRSLMDVHVILDKYSGKWDGDKVGRLLADTKLTDFEEKIRALSDYWFGQSDYSVSLQETIDYICESGIYGTVKHSLDNQVKEQGKYRLFLVRLLPPFDTMIKLYPWLRKAPVLLPVCWVMRLVSAMIVKPRKVWFQIKTILGHRSDD